MRRGGDPLPRSPWGSLKTDAKSPCAYAAPLTRYSGAGVDRRVAYRQGRERKGPGSPRHRRSGPAPQLCGTGVCRGRRVSADYARTGANPASRTALRSHANGKHRIRVSVITSPSEASRGDDTVHIRRHYQLGPSVPAP